MPEARVLLVILACQFQHQTLSTSLVLGWHLCFQSSYFTSKTSLLLSSRLVHQLNGLRDFETITALSQVPGDYSTY